MTKITLEIKKRSITFLYNRGSFYLLKNNPPTDQGFPKVI